MIKIGQILNQSEVELFYLEDADKKVIVNNISAFPATLQVEVIDWISEEEFMKRGKVNAFHAESVILSEPVPNIREFVLQQLIVKYPELVI